MEALLYVTRLHICNFWTIQLIFLFNFTIVLYYNVVAGIYMSFVNLYFPTCMWDFRCLLLSSFSYKDIFIDYSCILLVYNEIFLNEASTYYIKAHRMTNSGRHIYYDIKVYWKPLLTVKTLPIKVKYGGSKNASWPTEAKLNKPTKY